MSEIVSPNRAKPSWCAGHLAYNWLLARPWSVKGNGLGSLSQHLGQVVKLRLERAEEISHVRITTDSVLRRADIHHVEGEHLREDLESCRMCI
jgi:hypothetical protein